MKINRVIFVIIAFLLSIVVILPITAQGKENTLLVYEGDGKENRNFYIKQDELFGSFKEILPGDKLTQKLTIQNNSSVNVDIALASVEIDQKDKEFLKYFTLEIKEHDVVYYKGLFSEISQNKEIIDFGTVPKGVSRELDLNLDTDLNMPNEFSSYESTSTWVFLATVKDGKSAKSLLPQQGKGGRSFLPSTGEKNNLGLITLGVLLVTALGVFLRSRFNRQK